VLGSSNRPLKSLTDMIKGKQGRFRENLLGKRVDYSARSVIVVGPELKLHQCGLPKKIALELFQPFIIRRLKELNHADTIKSAKKMLERKEEQVWDILEEVIKNHPVLLNRAPTLHRMGIQAFEPTLIEGNAIRIHPLVCKGFNADFDGDQMAVHLPLSIEAQVEATVLMMSTNNIFSPANGQPIISPSQDIVMGCYYLTATRGELGESGEHGEGKTFANVEEVFAAYDQKKLGVHARIFVRLPIDKKVISEVRFEKNKTRVEEIPRKSNDRVLTTVGRVLFNDILNPKMAYYDLALSSKQLARIIADCYQLLGRRETINLLDRMKDLGFRESTRSGLSFSTDDLRTPANKEKVLAETEKRVDTFRKQYDRGNITEVERYNNVIDLWTHARDQITDQMMDDLRNDKRPDEDGQLRPYLNPIFLMANSGARGGTEQIRQLAGMRGLMAKPNGTIIETPIKANFREGLSVLEYFSSTHGARKGLADTALKTADSGYLTRKLADVAQNVVITMHDCGTTQGVTKGVMYKGEQIERPLSETIRGRVARNTIMDPVANQPVVSENEMISWEAARKIESMGIDKIMVRSPMTCQAPLGVCRLCYGMDLATGALVEEGMAVGIIAAQSIGEPGTQLTMRTFHIGGVVKRETGESDHKAKRAGTVRYERIKDVINEKSERIALTRNGEIKILDKAGKELESYPVPNGAVLLVENGAQVAERQVMCRWDPHITPIIAEQDGRVRFDEILEDQTLRKERDEATGAERWVIMEHKGDLHPQIVIEDERGQILFTYYMPEKAYLEVRDGSKVTAGTLLAKTPREVSGTQDIVGGLPRVTEIFEARTPRDPAKMAEVAGIVRLGEKKRGKRLIFVQPVDENGKPVGEEREHQVPPGKHLRVHTGDRVKEGDRLVFGPLVPHEILKISGLEEVQRYLVHEVQSVYRSQRVDIDDKHIEIIVAQMLRKVKVDTMGDTGLLPGSVIDKFAFRAVNDRLKECVKVKDGGDSKFQPDRIVAKESFEEERARLEGESKELPTFTTPTLAECSTQLLGITKASVQSDSFISAASFQETTKVLTEAALAGKVDYLVGLKENVILGHLVPAGTGFRTHQEAEVRLNAPPIKIGTGDGEATPSAAESETVGAK
jgi:DNA-directed RNA polymerase subunit beta'